MAEPQSAAKDYIDAEPNGSKLHSPCTIIVGRTFGRKCVARIPLVGF